MAVFLSLFAGAGQQFFTNAGVPLAGGKIFTYGAGGSTPQATYTTSAGNIAHSNPIVLDAAGRVPGGGEIWLTSNLAYKFVLQTAGNVTVQTLDNVSGGVDGASLAASGGSALVGFIQAGSGAVARTAQSKMRETVSVKDFGAVGDGVADDTAAIQAAHAASLQVHYPRGTYKINWPESTALVTYSNQSRICITGDNALLYDTRNYAVDSVSAVFQFTTCTDVIVDGLNYEGQPIVNKSNPVSGVGYRGATFVNLSTNCANVTVNADLKYLRYGIRGGDYSLPALGYNNNISGKLTTLECGYPVALYLSDDIDFDITAEGSHRSAYLAGVRGGRCHVLFKDQYIAPAQVLLTDSTTNGQNYPTGTSRGCSNLDIKAYDLGSTIWTANSFCAAISMSRGDPVLFEDLKFDVYVKSNDTTAATLSSFALFNNFTPIQPSYPNNWESTFVYRNIKLTGTLDRSDQTIAENSTNGEIYIYATDGTRNGTLQGVDITGYRYYPGSGAKTRGFWIFMPGLIGTSRIEACDFGTTTPVLIATNNTSVTSVASTQLRGSYVGTSDSPYNSNISFIDSIIADPANQPLINKTFFNTTIKSTKTAVVTKIIDTAALSGASVTLSGAIPAGVVVVGVSGIVTTAITGASGFEVGIATDTTRYADKLVVAQGTTITAVTDSTATGPINYTASTNLVITAKTSNFTGGVIRLAIHYISFTNLTL